MINNLLLEMIRPLVMKSQEHISVNEIPKDCIKL